jgi:hypothetical protein
MAQSAPQLQGFFLACLSIVVNWAQCERLREREQLGGPALDPNGAPKEDQLG